MARDGKERLAAIIRHSLYPDSHEAVAARAELMLQPAGRVRVEVRDTETRLYVTA